MHKDTEHSDTEATGSIPGPKGHTKENGNLICSVGSMLNAVFNEI